jgi:hypothetical protein
MMQWLLLLTVTLIFAVLGKQLKPVDEVYALALYIAGILSALWGFAIAPISAQLVLSALVFGWLQVSALRI